MNALRPPSPLRFLLIAGGVFLALLALGAWAISIQAEREWERALAEADALHAELHAVEDERPVLFGEATEDASGPLLIAAARALGVSGSTAREAVDARTPEERAARARLLEDEAAALVGAHAAARARRSGWRLEVSGWLGGPDLPVLELMHLGHLLAAEARAALDAGRAEQAVDVLLDRYQIARDLSQSFLLVQEMVGYAILAPDVDAELYASGALARLPEAERLRLERGLVTLAEHWPLASRGFEGEQVGMVRLMEEELGLGGYAGPGITAVGLRSARRGWSVHWEVADHYLRAGAALRDHRAAQAGSDLGDQLRLADELDARVAAFDNGITQLVRTGHRSQAEVRAATQARTQLLAGALAALRGAEPREALRDPFLVEHAELELRDDAVVLRVPGADFAAWRVELAR